MRGWAGIWQKHLLYDLEECSVKLGEDLVAVFKLKTNIVGFYPCNVLKHGEHKISGWAELESSHEQKAFLEVNIDNLLATQPDTWATYLEEIEVSVELSTFCVLQSFELPRDEHENVLETSEILTEKSSHKNTWRKPEQWCTTKMTNSLITPKTWL